MDVFGFEVGVGDGGCSLDSTSEIRRSISRLMPPKKLPEVFRMSVDNRGRCRWETLSTHRLGLTMQEAEKP